MPAEYAHALVQALERAHTQEEKETCVSRLIDVLKTNGKLKALPAIVRELERIEAQQESAQATLTLARSSDETHARSELATILSDATPQTVTIDEHLIGGWRYSAGDTLVDASHKHALLTLYRRVISAG